jgi:thiol-disulfide isomerase/thioredoxin
MKTIGYIAVAVVAAAAGFGIYRYTVAPQAAMEHESGPVEERLVIEDGPPPASEDTDQAAKVPDVLPDFTLADLDGTQRSIRGWQGKSMIVNFWATWCAPCRREIPLLKKLNAEHAAEGFQIVGVAVDFRDDVVKYAKEIGINYPVLVGEQDGLDAVNKFNQGSLGFPFTVFTDNQQRIVVFHLGEIEPAEADVLLGAVRKVNSGELTPEAARIVAAKQLAELEKPAA